MKKYSIVVTIIALAEKNMRTFTGPRSSVIDMGYTPCARCSP